MSCYRYSVDFQKPCHVHKYTFRSHRYGVKMPVASTLRWCCLPFYLSACQPDNWICLPCRDARRLEWCRWWLHWVALRRMAHNGVRDDAWMLGTPAVHEWLCDDVRRHRAPMHCQLCSMQLLLWSLLPPLLAVRWSTMVARMSSTALVVVMCWDAVPLPSLQRKREQIYKTQFRTIELHITAILCMINMNFLIAFHH